MFFSTGLLWTAKNGYIKIAKLLIKIGANVNVQNRNGHTPLHLATQPRHTEAIKLLIEKGADVDAQDHYGHTTLFFAAANGHTEIVFMLLIYGATLNDDDRSTINGKPNLKDCLTAFEQIKAMPQLGELIEIKKKMPKLFLST